LRSIIPCAFMAVIWCVSLAVGVSAQYGLNLICRDDTIQQVPPSSTAVFRFALTNTGATRDSFNLQVPLEADSFPSDEWCSLMSVSGALLPSGSTTHIDLTPDSADTTIQVHIYTYSVYPSWGTGKTTLFIASEGDPAVRDSVNLRARVSQFLCGDCNGDGRITTADASYTISYIYREGAAPIGEADVNVDGRISVADAQYSASYIYRDGSEPCNPP
jgi:hypothetical protein